MKVTCGIDIIEIERIKESIENLGAKFLERVYTKKEIEYCEEKSHRNISTMLLGLLQKKLHLKLFHGR